MPHALFTVVGMGGVSLVGKGVLMSPVDMAYKLPRVGRVTKSWEVPGGMKIPPVPPVAPPWAGLGLVYSSPTTPPSPTLSTLTPSSPTA